MKHRIVRLISDVKKATSSGLAAYLASCDFLGNERFTLYADPLRTYNDIQSHKMVGKFHDAMYNPIWLS